MLRLANIFQLALQRIFLSSLASLMNSVGNNVQQFVIAFPQFSLSLQILCNVPQMKHTLHTVFALFPPHLFLVEGGRWSFLKGEIHKLNFQRLLSDFVRAVAVDLTGGIVVYLHAAHTHTTHTHALAVQLERMMYAPHTPTHTVSLTAVKFAFAWRKSQKQISCV